MIAQLLALCLIVFFCGTLLVGASTVCNNDELTTLPREYRERQRIQGDVAYVPSVAQNYHITIIQACRGEDPSGKFLDQLLANVFEDRDIAFRLVVMTRVLFFMELNGDDYFDQATRDNVQTQILRSIRGLPFWLTRGETKRVYWTENMQIMWMGSAWLLSESVGIDTSTPSSSSLRYRLLHYLNLKLEYGFSEFLSEPYYPFTLAGLLNLADFCQDGIIRDLATRAVMKLLKEILIAANDEGVFHAASGRGFVRSYTQVRFIPGTVWLLTGHGSKSSVLHHATSFLATSSLDVTSVLNSYSQEIDTSVVSGPSLREYKDWNIPELNRVDRTIFQWSMGGYFSPYVDDDTKYVFDKLDLWGHEEFDDFAAFEVLPPFVSALGSGALATITRSSDISGVQVNVFRNRGVVLSSAQNFWPGYLGHQSYPWMAAIGTETVWTQSGPIKTSDWLARPNLPSQTTLPYVEQKGNVALIMYNRNDDIGLLRTFARDSPLAVDNFDVALHWPRWEEEDSFGRWLMARDKKNNYIAVARHCINYMFGNIPVCTDEHQTWAVIVGNAAMYGTFANFRAKVTQNAKYEHSFRKPSRWCLFRCKPKFKGQIQFEGTLIAHTWQ